ncbi:unnamed protein product, partial [Brassica napus]
EFTDPNNFSYFFKRLILKSYNTIREICSKESISTSDQKISQSYAINLPRQLILFVNTQSYRLFLKYLSVTFPLHSTASKILSSPIDLPTIKINNCTIQHNTLFNFFPFPNLAIYTVRFKTKVPHNVILKSTSINHWDEVVVTNDLQMDEGEDDNEEDDQEVDHRNRANKNVISWDVGVCDVENHELPRLVYLLVRPGFDYHKKAGAMNLLIRVSGFLSIVPYLLNLGKKICYDHYPQRFDGISRHDRYSNGSIVFYDMRNSTKLYDHCRYRYGYQWEPDLVGSLTPKAENSIGVMVEVYWQQDGSG